MFGFAQFAHLLPYILLAITSFAGLTGYTLNYAQQKTSSPENTEKEIQVTPSETSDVENTAHFFTNHKGISAELNIDSDQFFNFQAQSFLIPPYLNCVFTELHDSALNQRPPPLCSFV